MKRLLLVVIAILLVSCAARDPNAERLERERKASMSPAQRCMENADINGGWCGVGCGLFPKTTVEATRQQECRVTCDQQKMLAYQMCTYK